MSDKIGLGRIIETLRSFEHQDWIVPNGWAEPMSYRGNYADLAFEPAKDVSIASMLAYAESALGKTFCGYKGGDYLMSEYTDCWISEYGEASDDFIGPMLLDLILRTAHEGMRK